MKLLEVLLISVVVFAVFVYGTFRFIARYVLGEWPEHEFPCTDCVHFNNDTIEGRCNAVVDGVKGRPRFCSSARGNKACYKSARKMD